MIRLIYSLLLYLIQPLVWLRLLWRARRQPEYLRHLGERYGFYPGQPAAPLLWLHAVSVGETRAAEPLIAALLAAYPEHALLLTHMTPTGRAAGAELLRRYGPRLSQAYLPYDLPGACARFFSHFAPRLGLLMETEIWPNLIAAARARQIPALLVNARLSARSQDAYRRFLPLVRPAVEQLAAVAAQTPADARRLQDIGARKVLVTGNLKFDVTPDPKKLELGAAWRRAFGTRPVWLAASTREGEEALILDAFTHFEPGQPHQPHQPDTLLLLVPRHPQRFNAVAALLKARGLPFQRRSAGLPAPETRVWLGDSMGEMPAYFAAADLALIGGTLLPFGGQNLIEAAACGCPVLAGPHTDNFAQATEDAITHGAARRVTDATHAVQTARQLLADKNTLPTDSPASELQAGEENKPHPDTLTAMRQAATEFSQTHRGATARTLALVGEHFRLRPDPVRGKPRPSGRGRIARTP